MKKLNTSEASNIIGGSDYTCETHYVAYSSTICYQETICKDKHGNTRKISRNDVKCVSR
ncbi:uncharacterized protein DUF4762 [Serratia fonticola]|uniref:Uncharacterized protein DUF4762 n=1 Tax=Serratia fonticola TaxID=47917 RepID=A0A559TB22_SERFO|nr:uncharacterized protein DUF4762 [Serratia fonticola]TQI97307.1 uncharacterized protein DUF4762 [Serratia fonticola]TVZ71803.1 uncharacterized protein DUF4762 [Serratia fonticola]